MPVTFTDDDIAQAQPSAAGPQTFTDADVAQVHPPGPTRHNDTAGKPKPGTPGADAGIPDEGIMGQLFTPIRGVQRIATGAHRLGATGEGETRGGVADIIHGTMELLTPYLPEAAITAPLAFISSLAGAKLGGAAAKGLTSDDASPGARQLAEVGGELAGGGLGFKGGKATSSGIRAATDLVRNAPDVIGRGARAVPDIVTTGLSKIEKAATLRPAVSDAIEMAPTAGPVIAAGARNVARAARTANRVIDRARSLGKEAPPVRGAAPDGVAYPGAQDPAAIESRAPQIDTSTEISAERLQQLEANRVAGKPQTFTDADVAPATPGAQDPAAIEPLHPQFDAAVEATPIRPRTTGEPTAAAEVPQEAPSVHNPDSANEPVPDAAAPAAEPAQRPLLEEPAYNRQVDEQGKPTKPDYQAAARTVKGRAMARLLMNPPAGPAITLEEARSIPLGDPRWNTIAELAGVNPPTSQQALEAVYKHMDDVGAGRAQLDLKGTSTDAAGAVRPDAGTLPADGGTPQSSPAAGPLEAAQPREGSQGLPAAQPAASGDRPGAGKTAPDVVRIPGESRNFPITYRVRELDEIQPSHSGISFQPNPKYGLVNDRNYTRPENQGKIIEGSGGRFAEDLHITDNSDPSNGPPVTDTRGNAIGGNGRTMQLQRVYAYNPEGAARYRSLLMKKAEQFGIDPADVAKMKRPILVREIADEHLGNPQHAVTDLNKTGTAALTPSERAIADSRRVSPNTLDEINRRLVDAGDDATLSTVLSSPGHGPEILNRLIDDGVVTSQEKAALVSGDKLTPAGKQRVAKLMLGRFFRDPAQLDTVPPQIVPKLERIAAPIAKLEDAGPWNLMPKLQEALDLLDEMHAYGRRDMGEFLKQNGLMGESRYTQDAIGLAKTLQRATGKNITAAVKSYQSAAAEAAAYADAKGGMFADQMTEAEPKRAQQAFEDAFRPGGKPLQAQPKPKPAEEPKAAAGKAGLAAKIGQQLVDLLKNTEGSIRLPKGKGAKSGIESHDLFETLGADPEYQSRIDAERATAELANKSRKRVDSGKESIEDSPLFGGPRQGGLF